MRELVSKALKWVDLINSGMLIFCAGLVSLMVVSTTWEVVGRYLFNSPTAWSLELSENLMVAVVFLGAGYCFMVGGHINIDILYIRLNGKNRTIVDMVASIVGAIFVGAVLWQVYLYFLELLKTRQTSGGAMDWPLWPIMLVCVIGSLLFFLQILAKLIRCIAALKQNRDQ